MEVKIKYNGINERQAKIKKQEAQGLRMLHDNFDKSWKSGEEPHGTMIFTDVMPPVVEPEPVVDYQAKWDKASTTADKLKVLAGRVGIKVS